MFDLLFRGSRHGTNWFARARAVAAIAVVVMLGLALVGWIAVMAGWMGPALSSWFGFSLLPLAGLVVLQTTTRVQEALTMRFGGRPVATEGGGE